MKKKLDRKATKKKMRRKKRFTCSACGRRSTNYDCCVIFSTIDNPMG